MGEGSLVLYLVLFLILAAEFVNGWTDAPNAIATVVSTRVFSPLVAVIVAAVFNLLGAMSGTAVAETIGLEIVNPDVINMTTIASSMIAIVTWSSITARLGLPTSESHALVAGLGGAGIATAGFSVLVWEGWKKVLLGLVFSSFIGFIVGVGLMSLIYHLFKNCKANKTKRLFHYLQMLSAAFIAFGHGSNDGQKFMGVFSLALLMHGYLTVFMIPKWVMFLCAGVLAIGTLTGGWRILKTMGFKVTKLETPQGFGAEMAAGSTIQVASYFGVPLSTTHTINTAIMGVGAVKRLSAVRWIITRQIVFAWILTFPACALIGYIVAYVLQFFTRLNLF
jgi:PiT family inorganic phosphate transporter